MKLSVLVVDDDPGIRFTLRELLEDEGLDVIEAEDGETGLGQLARDRINLVITDLRMPRVDGLELLSRVRSMEAAPPVVMLTAHGSERDAVEAMKRGAIDYLPKPFELDELLRVVRRTLEPVRLIAEKEQLAGQLNLARSLVFRSSAMRELATRVQRVGPRDVTVLIQGESGTGKERVAEALVRASARADRPYVRFNCAALSPELVEAELFGHARGAFTGADRSRGGLFREADGGTLLLDEVAELDERAQASLLRVLQEREVRPVGADSTVPVDVRIIASTHRDLESRVRSGEFREDLLYRLRVVTLRVPPLRERPEDIRALADHFARIHGERFGVPARLTEDLHRRLETYAWPGNVRELENAIEGMMALSDGRSLDPSLLPGLDGPSRAARLEERMRAYERGLLRSALDQCGGRRTDAARLLGIGRATLHEKLRKHGLGRDEG